MGGITNSSYIFVSFLYMQAFRMCAIFAYLMISDVFSLQATLCIQHVHMVLNCNVCCLNIELNVKFIMRCC